MFHACDWDQERRNPQLCVLLRVLVRGCPSIGRGYFDGFILSAFVVFTAGSLACVDLVVAFLIAPHLRYGRLGRAALT